MKKIYLLIIAFSILLSYSCCKGRVPGIVLQYKNMSKDTKIDIYTSNSNTFDTINHFQNFILSESNHYRYFLNFQGGIKNFVIVSEDSTKIDKITDASFEGTACGTKKVKVEYKHNGSLIKKDRLDIE